MRNLRATDKGSLYIVGTPIGNLEDISLRAISILKSVDVILAEDTRHSQHLLNALGIKKTLSSLHAHNEGEKSKKIIAELLEGKSFALISDAGTPLISDPGFPLVQMARLNDIPVIPIPGPSALIAALSASGLACDSFLFIGFLPPKTSARNSKLKSLANEQHTLVLYESTHRLMACLDSLSEIYGKTALLVLAKELTKAHECFIQESVDEIRHWLLEDPRRQKGEFVLMIPPRQVCDDNETEEALLKVLLAELPLKQAVSIAHKLTKINKNDLYESALKLKEVKQ